MEEFALIAQLTERLKTGKLAGEVAAGDDCAAFAWGEHTLLLTCDAAVEGQHFVSHLTPWHAIGWRLATANVSDVYACGGQPMAALVSLAVPKHLASQHLQTIYDGLQAAATHYGFSVLGGNVSEADQLQLHMMMLGTTTQFVGRDGAQVGDWVAVSGPLGGAEAGRLLWSQRANPQNSATPPCTSRGRAASPQQALEGLHLHPKAPTQQAQALTHLAHAAIDISDGLGAELQHLAKASQVAFYLQAQSIPYPAELPAWCQATNQALIPWVLGAGEEYQLLITGPPAQRQPACQAGFTIIGEVKGGHGVWLDGQALEQPPGWKHLA